MAESFSEYYRRLLRYLDKEAAPWARDNIGVSLLLFIGPIIAVFIARGTTSIDWRMVVTTLWFYAVALVGYLVFHFIRAPWKLANEQRASSEHEAEMIHNGFLQELTRCERDRDHYRELADRDKPVLTLEFIMTDLLAPLPDEEFTWLYVANHGNRAAFDVQISVLNSQYENELWAVTFEPIQWISGESTQAVDARISHNGKSLPLFSKQGRFWFSLFLVGPNPKPPDERLYPVVITYKDRGHEETNTVKVVGQFTEAQAVRVSVRDQR